LSVGGSGGKAKKNKFEAAAPRRSLISSNSRIVAAADFAAWADCYHLYRFHSKSFVPEKLLKRKV